MASPEDISIPPGNGVEEKGADGPPELELTQLFCSNEPVENDEKKSFVVSRWNDYTVIGFRDGKGFELYDSTGELVQDSVLRSSSFSVNPKRKLADIIRDKKCAYISGRGASNRGDRLSVDELPLHIQDFANRMLVRQGTSIVSASLIEGTDIPMVKGSYDSSEQLKVLEDGKYILLINSKKRVFDLYVTQNENGIIQAPRNWRHFEYGDVDIPDEVEKYIQDFLKIPGGFNDLNNVKYSAITTDASLNIVSYGDLDGTPVFSDSISMVANNVTTDPSNRDILFYCQASNPEVLFMLDMSGDPSEWKEQGVGFPKSYSVVKNLQLDPTGTLFIFYTEDSLVVLDRYNLEEIKQEKGLKEISFDSKGDIYAIDGKGHLVAYRMDTEGYANVLLQRRARAVAGSIDIDDIFSPQGADSLKDEPGENMKELESIKEEWEIKLRSTLEDITDTKTSHRFRESLIILKDTLRAQRLSETRFSYKNAQEVLDGKAAKMGSELLILDKLSKKLRAERIKKGSIDFEQEEVEIELDEKNVPTRIYRKKLLDTNKLIEDFMLLANREVATYIFKEHKKSNTPHGFLYRVHDLPDPEKIEQISSLLNGLGYTSLKAQGRGRKRKSSISPSEINAVFKEIEGSPVENMIKTAMIRSMSKAEYTTKNIGHFGLGFSYYTHFTSPIRRYSDLLVHRLLERHLDGSEVTSGEAREHTELAWQLSQTESVIQSAERESIKYKQTEYWSSRIGEKIKGVITGVTDWGFYVEEKDTGAEGLVRVATLKDDFYIYDENKYRLTGKRTKKTYSLGDMVTVSVTAADVERRTIDFIVP